MGMASVKLNKVGHNDNDLCHFLFADTLGEMQYLVECCKSADQVKRKSLLKILDLTLNQTGSLTNSILDSHL